MTTLRHARRIFAASPAEALRDAAALCAVVAIVSLGFALPAFL